jgi:DNA invertase Pin-like site-specific DNA recombinase
MKVIGYIRVSTDKQDLDKQHHLLLDYAQKQGLRIDEFIEVEISSRKNAKERRIEELVEKLDTGDTLIVAELSRLGRNMLETLNIINQLSESGVKIIFVRQPELSTTGSHAKLLLAIYSYFAEAEREYISLRTKQGLAAAKAQGQQLGRPKGSKNKERVLDPHRDQLRKFLQLGLNLAAIRQIINPQLAGPITYNSYKYYVQHDEELAPLWQGPPLLEEIL